MRLQTIIGHGVLAALLALVALAPSGPAYSEAKDKLSKKAFAGCGGKFEKSGKRMRMDANGNFICPANKPMMTRHEAFNACRDQMGPYSFMVVKTNKGWFCRYHAP